MSDRIHRFLDRIESRISLFAVLGGSSLVGVFTGWLSQGVEAINQFGWFGWWASGLIGALLAVAILLSLAWMRYAWIHARVKQKWSERVDDFNPLERDIRNKRMNIHDLMHPLSRRVSNKRLYDCELIGPANIFLHEGIHFSRVTFADCTAVALWPDKAGKVYPGNAVIFENVEMQGGSIWQATLLIPPSLVKTFAQMGVPFVTLTGDPETDAAKASIE